MAGVAVLAAAILSLAVLAHGKSRADASAKPCPPARRIPPYVLQAIRAVDRLLPRPGGPAVMRAGYPILALHTDKSDARHLVRAHEKSLREHKRTADAADMRKMSVVFAGKRRNVDVGLDDVYAIPEPPRRPSFIIRGDIPELLGDCRTARLYPPEAHAAIHPDARDVLPLAATYVRLYEDDAFKGLYVVEPFDTPGSAWMSWGAASDMALRCNGRPKPSDILPPGVALPDALRQAASMALSDNLFPWSGLELAMRRRDHETAKRATGFTDFDDQVATVESVIGDNRAPMFITRDLPLSSIGDSSVTWRSSDPAVIATDGTVNRPEGSSHAIVTLTATNEATGAVQNYRLRVMANGRTLPTLFISIGSVTTEDVRQDFTATFIAAEEEGAPVRLSGLVGAGGGLRHRGRVPDADEARRSMSMKFEEPFSWPDPEHPSKHIILHGGLRDPTHLRRKISLDAFCAAYDGRFPSPCIALCEVFVNGEWMGVWEASRRVRDLVPPDATITGPDGDDEVDFDLDNMAAYYTVLSFIGESGRTDRRFAKLPDRHGAIVIPWGFDQAFRRIERRLNDDLLERLITRHEDFEDRMKFKWSQLRAGPLSDDALFRRINEDIARLGPYMDEEQRLVKPYRGDGDFLSESESLKSMVRRQLDFMDRAYGR